MVDGLTDNRALSVILDESEKLQIEQLFKDKWLNYLISWEGENNTEEWNKRKGNNTQWLGDNAHHAYFDLSIELLPKYLNGDKVYQIDYFECGEFDLSRFVYSANSSKRKFLPNGENLNYETFYSFCLEILTECVNDLINE